MGFEGDSLTITPVRGDVGASEQLQFFAAGGAPPYQFEIISGHGDIDRDSGLFTASFVLGESVVRLSDSAQVHADAVLSTVAPLTISPTTATTAVSHTITFTTTGGVPPIRFTVEAGHASIDVSSGELVAGTTPGVVRVLATDIHGTQLNATVTVNPALSIVASQDVFAGTTTPVGPPAGGVPPYLFTLLAGQGQLDSISGSYSAPSSAGQATIGVSDQLGGQQETLVNVVQRPGTRDLNFGTNGMASVDFRAPVEIRPSRGVMLDDAIYVSGTLRRAASSSRDLVIAKLLPSGEPDAAFGNLGAITIIMPETAPTLAAMHANSYTKDLAVVGSTNTAATGDCIMFAFTETGAPLTADSPQRIDFGGDEQCMAVTGTPGRVFVAGRRYDDALVARLATDGRLDNAFNGSGFATYDVSGGGADVATHIIAYADASLLVGVEAAGQVKLLRLLSDGTPDLTFGTGGQITPIFVTEELDAMFIDTLGRIIVGRDDAQSIVLERFLPSGLPDMSFGVTGHQRVGAAAGVSLADLTSGPDGAIIVGGSGPAPNNYAIYRLDENGNPDLTFGEGGRVGADLSPWTDQLKSVAVTTSGSIVGFGSVGFGVSSFGSIRLTPLGSFDPTYGNIRAGVNYYAPGHSAEDTPHSAILGSDGTLYIVGSSKAGLESAHVARIAQDGTPVGFDETQTLLSDLAFKQNASDIVETTPGTFLVSGTSWAGLGSESTVWFLKGDGSLDTTKHDDGRMYSDGPAMARSGEAMAVDNLGRVVVAGLQMGSGSRHTTMVTRFMVNGGFDLSFGIDGLALLDVSPEFETANDLLVEPDDSIVVLGSALNTDWDVAVSKFFSDGTVDTSFGNANGSFVWDGGHGDDRAFAMIAVMDTIIVAGFTSSAAGNDDMLLFAITATGQLDSTFGIDGIATLDFTNATDGPADDAAYTLIVDEEGRLFTGGYSTRSGELDSAVVRWSALGVPDMSFGTQGSMRWDGGGNDAITSLVLMQPHYLAAVGYAQGTLSRDIAVSRIWR